MPKVVDHEARRRELAEAVWRVISNEGVHRASVRAVAAESGWSTGSLRHYFTTQDALLAFAMELLTDRVRERLRAIQDEDTRTILRKVSIELLPTTEQTRVESEVWLALLARAQVEPSLRRAERDTREALFATFNSILWRAVARGELAESRDTGVESIRFIAMLDGLVLACLFGQGQVDGEVLLAVVDRHLEDLLGNLPA